MRAIVGVHLLPHPPAGPQPHARRRTCKRDLPKRGLAVHRAHSLCSVPRCQRLLGQADGPQLDSTVSLLSGDLPFDCGSGAERHGNELPDESVPRADAVQPRLIRQHNVILRIFDQVLDPRQAADGTHLADTDLQSSGFGSIEGQPHRLALVDRQHHPATSQPLSRCGVGVVGNPPQRKPAQTRR